jgi:L-aminopeptidase/D-esterase-like protein
VTGGSLTDVDGVAVGHWTDAAAATGCTVALFPDGTVASGEVRGGAPATREFDLLAPERLVAHLDAVVLSGGSAFGLAACDGVARWCEREGRGFETRGGKVPIVVGAAIYDLTVGDGTVRPGPAEGEAACASARDATPFATGPVGAGTGATIGKWRGPDAVSVGGIGTASWRGAGGLTVGALVVVNAFGDVLRPGEEPAVDWPEVPHDALPFANTTIGVIATNAALDKTGCLLVAQSGHDGLARALSPVHTRADGDALVAASCGPVEAVLDHVRLLAAAAVTGAVRDAVFGERRATPGSM